MAFRLGNFNIDEILFGVAQNFNDELLYTLFVQFTRAKLVHLMQQMYFYIQLL